MPRYAALLRGVNVGPSKRIAMSELQLIVERLGFEEVTTVLNTGNVVFTAKKASEKAMADRIFESIETRHGFKTNTLVLTASDLDAIIKDNPLADVATNPAKYIVAFPLDPKVLYAAKPLAAQNWGDERLAVTARAIYIWAPGGVLASKVLEALNPLGKDLMTTRNWSTVLKIQAATRVRD